MSLTFLANIIAFIKLVPLKHAQYFILFSPFIAFYFAEFVFAMNRSITLLIPSPRRSSFRLSTLAQGHLRGVFRSAIFVAILVFITVKGYQMYSIKSKWNNTKTFDELTRTYQAIPPGSYVWDLYGQTIFYKDPYYICCIPYGQYGEAFGFVLPDLARSLEETETRYIFAHNQGRLSVLPAAHQKYIEENFVRIVDDPLIYIKSPK